MAYESFALNFLVDLVKYCSASILFKLFHISQQITAVCKKVGGRRFGQFENKQDKTDPKLGFAPPGA